MSEKLQLSEEEVKKAMRLVTYADEATRALLVNAFILHKKKHGGLESDSVHRMLQHVHNSGLISGDIAQSAQQKIFQAAA
jgi:hypothetical protein